MVAGSVAVKAATKRIRADIERERKRRGLSHRELSRLAMLDEGAPTSWLSGAQDSCQLRIVVALAEALGMVVEVKRGVGR